MHHYSSFITIKLTTIIVAILLQVIGVSTLKLTAYEGDKIFIPCFTTLSQSAYYWEIQGIFYSMNNLSSANIQGVSTGLTVYHALPQTAGSYSCYTHYGEKSTLIKISTVQLVIRITPQFAGKGRQHNNYTLYTCVCVFDTFQCLQKAVRMLKLTRLLNFRSEPQEML